VNFWQENHRFYELENRSVAQSIYPLLHRRLSELQARSVLDFGCGDGRLLEALQGVGRQLAGYDISPQGRELARTRLGSDAHIFGPPDPIPDANYDAVVNSMVLMTLPDKTALASALRELARCLRPGGTILSAVTHPCFRGRKFSDFVTGWVDGADSYFTEGRPFYVTLFDERAGLSVTFDDYHYSVSAYFNAIVNAGLALTALYELPDPSPHAPGTGTYPAFLILEARRA
jgi:SAM-dependent methyltransferase